MSHRPRSHATLPEDLPLLKILAELAGVLMLPLGVKAVKFVRWLMWPQTEGRSAPIATLTNRPEARPMPPLQWRSPWWACRSLAWAIATLTSPTFVFIGSLLAINSRSAPLFWWSLPVIVAIGNAVAILWINQQHHRDPFTDQPRWPGAMSSSAPSPVPRCSCSSA